MVVHEKLSGNWSELSRLAGLRPSTLQGIKDGKDPRGNTLLRISDALNVSVDWLLTGQGLMYRNQSTDSFDDTLSKRHTALLQLFNGLSEKQQREILATVQEKERLNKIEQLLNEMLKKVGYITNEESNIIENKDITHHCPFKDDLISRTECHQRSSGPRPFGGQRKLEWWNSCQHCEHKTPES